MRGGPRLRTANASVEYSVEEDLIHTTVPPFEFYHLKPGAKGRIRKDKDKKRDDPDKAPEKRRPWYFVESLIPLTSDDVAHLYNLALEIWALCPMLWMKYLFLEVINALLPSLALFFQGQLFHVMQTAVDHREIDRAVMIRAALGAAGCSIATRFVGSGSTGLEIRLAIGARFADGLISAWSHLDVPTAKDPTSLARLSNQRLDGAYPWTLVTRIISYATTTLRLATQVWMLLRVFRQQEGAAWLVFWCFAAPVVQRIHYRRSESYAVIQEYKGQRRETISEIVNPRMKSMKRRQEIVANNLADYFVQSFEDTEPTVKQPATSREVWERYKRNSYSVLAAQMARDALSEAPKIAFAIQALHTPAQIPLSLTTLTVIQTQVNDFTRLLFGLFDSTTSIRTLMASTKELSRLRQLPNIVKDGWKPIHKEGRGVSVEFQNVSFRYPGKDTFALSNVSFRLEAGALCVLVGGNGEGKSSILKLLTRIYDPTEGSILLDDEPIQNFLLADLRRITSVLFQDFHNFPVSIEENIRIGDVDTALDPLDSDALARINRAAELGGASELIAALPKGLKTELEQTGLSFNHQGPHGGDVLAAVTKAREAKNVNNETGLSGGQEQRLALARTFMKQSKNLSMLVYDEPSASLDPQAEYDLFERVKALRQEGQKTMVFSTHRFGNLNKHADVILYLKNSTIIESGTHADLMARQGPYAHLYQIQAQAFL